ncbi:hypothetical protein [Fervidibacter sacchari]
MKRRTLMTSLLLTFLATQFALATELGVKGSQFTINGKPAFLLGISYYGALGAPKEFILRDLDDIQRYGFNWLRVWATWSAFGKDVSAVDAGRTEGIHLARFGRHSALRLQLVASLGDLVRFRQRCLCRGCARKS